MPEPISWHQALKPIGRWLLRRLPAAVFAKWYTLGELREDIKIILDPSEALQLHLPKQRGAPSLWFSAKVLNASPYLDIRIKRFSVSLSVGEGELEEEFADARKWDEFDVPWGGSQLCRVTMWPNEFQTRTLQACHESKVPVTANVYVSVESAVGRVVVWHLFRRVHFSVK